MDINSSNRFGCLGAITGLILFATLGWGLLCYDPGYAEYERLCEQGKARILTKLPRIASYVDATGNGCSIGCMEVLQRKTVEFVEIRFDRQAFLSAKEGTLPAFEPGYPLPDKDGTYRVRLKAEEPSCLGLFGEKFSYEPELVNSCLVFEPIPRLTSRYEYKETWVRKNYSMGTIGGSFIQYRDRTTDAVVASRGNYNYAGVAMRLTPLYYQQSCGDGYFRLEDLFE